MINRFVKTCRIATLLIVLVIVLVTECNSQVTFTGSIWRITTGGVVTHFAIPSGNDANHIISGPDGNVWFAEATGNQIGRITPGGDVTEFPVPTPNGYPYGITAGPDGNVWFVE